MALIYISCYFISGHFVKCPRNTRVTSAEELGTISKNSLRGITLGIRPGIQRIHSLTLPAFLVWQEIIWLTAMKNFEPRWWMHVRGGPLLEARCALIRNGKHLFSKCSMYTLGQNNLRYFKNNLDSTCVLIAQQLCFHNASKHETDASDMIDCLYVVRIYSFMKKLNYTYALCISSFS